MPVSHFRQDCHSFIEHRSFLYAKPVTLLPQFSCFLWMESIHNRANNQPRLCVHVATFSGMSLAPWHANLQNKLPGRLPVRTRFREWVLSIHTAKTSTWVPTQKWALAWDTMICQKYYNLPEFGVMYSAHEPLFARLHCYK